MLRGLFEGAKYNSEDWAKCAVYSRARTKQGRGVIKEIRYTSNPNTLLKQTSPVHLSLPVLDHLQLVVSGVLWVNTVY